MQNEVVPAGGLPEIRVEKIVPARQSLLCYFSYDTPLEPYFNSSLLCINYGFEVEQIPESVLSIPVLGFLVPVAWTAGATVTAGGVDSSFVVSLRRVGEIMREMYPDLNISTNIRCSAADTPWPKGGERDCLLYSGGVDSTCSLLRNLGPNLVLASIRGTPDLRLWEDKFWERTERSLQPFLKNIGIERQVIETNALDVVNFRSLNATLKGLTEGWWENLSHGLILLSICAPFTYIGKIKRMMIAASFSQQRSEPWGSTPASDSSVAWGGVTTVHDSFDLARIEKIERILAPYMAQHPGIVQLRACTGRRDGRLASGTLNCGTCKKCARTALALMHAGIDPAECGFPPPNFPEIRRGLMSGRLVGPHPFSMKTIHDSRRLPDRELLARYPAYGEFLSWYYDWKWPVATRSKWASKLAPRGSRRRKLVSDILH
jgi:hypothetical protein